eukprot:SAG31_NODE_1597_length_7799_cov_37.912857_13_plen_81_part_00
MTRSRTAASDDASRLLRARRAAAGRAARRRGGRTRGNTTVINITVISTVGMYHSIHADRGDTAVRERCIPHFLKLDRRIS